MIFGLYHIYLAFDFTFPRQAHGKCTSRGLACDGLYPLPVEENKCCRDPDSGSRGLSPLPVKEKAVAWTWRANAMGFSPCLSKERPSHGHSARLRWVFPPVCRGKGRFMTRGQFGPTSGLACWPAVHECPLLAAPGSPHSRHQAMNAHG